jgi:hypothetical protein
MSRRVPIVIAALLIAAGCASAPVSDASPTAAALRRLCTLAEVRAASPVSVVSRTAPVLEPVALHMALAGDMPAGEGVIRLSETGDRLAREHVAETIPLPADTSCRWTPRAAREPYSEGLVIELSNVVAAGLAANPTPGLFARLSAGGRPGATFYWIPIESRDGRSFAGLPLELSVSDG